MAPPKCAPASLKVVAAIFFVSGVMCAIGCAFALLQHRVEINFGVLGLFIAPGILRFKRGWRTCALVFLWIGMLAMPIVAIILYNSLHDPWEIQGSALGSRDRAWRA